MEYVPEPMVDEPLKDCIVHPWLVVQQGSDKWRACQDYKNGINLFGDSLHFNLPSVWSVRKDTEYLGAREGAVLSTSRSTSREQMSRMDE